jgi:S-adenosylmethionine hydrolase
MQYATSMSVERETLKAELVSFDTDFGNITTWVPKSVLVA